MKVVLFHIITKKNRGDQAAERAIKQMLKRKFKNIKIISRNVKRIHLLSEKEIKMINNSDLVIIGGGGQYSRWLYPKSTKKLKKIKTSLIIYSVGYLKNLEGRGLTKKQKEKIRELNKIASLSSVRDKNSIKFLKEIGIKSDLVCDPAIFLKPEKPHRKNKSKLLYVGINIAFHKWAGQENWIEKLTQSYVDFLIKLRSEENIKIFYFKHSIGENKVIKKLKKVLPGLVVVDEKPEKLLQEYGKIDYFVGMMLHSTILSFNAGTPMISIGYDEKNKSFMKLIGMQKYHLPYSKANSKNILRLFRSQIRERTIIEEKFLHKKKELLKQHIDFLEKASKLIN